MIMKIINYGNSSKREKRQVTAESSHRGKLGEIAAAATAVSARPELELLRECMGGRDAADMI